MRRAAFFVLIGALSVPAMAGAQQAATSGAGGSSGGGGSSDSSGTGTGAAGSGGGETGSGATGASATAPQVLPTASAADVARAAPPEPERPTTPIMEIHGYLRARMELFSEFALGWDAFPIMSGGGRVASPETIYNGARLPWYRSPDWFSQWCNITDSGSGPVMPRPGSCTGGLQTTANMRLRLQPEIHPTENVVIHSQIDLLDNLVLGSTPEGYYGGLAQTPTGYVLNTRSPWAPITGFSSTQIAPTPGFNGIVESIAVRRAWAEVTNNSLGQIRFGRMPSHWGLGILANAGNGYDSDYQSTNDRIMYAARLRSLGVFLAAMWDFPSIGATSANRLNEPGQGQPYDLSTNDDVHQWIIALGRRMDPDAMRAAMARSEWVVNGGLYGVYRSQFMSGEHNAAVGLNGAGSMGSTAYGTQLNWRGAQAFIGDLWLQVLRSNFRFEMEAVYIRGGLMSIDVAPTPSDLRYTISQFGAAAEGEVRLLNNRLSIEFRTGYASGDPDMEGLNFFNGLTPQFRNDRFLSLFRFHPDYRIDLIFWRQIMRQFSGAYYFRPSVQYNFIQEPNGDLLYARADIIYSRASEFMQTRGNDSNLGIELNGTIAYQSNHYRRDGTEPARAAPGFYAMIQYGIFFPLGGLGPTSVERSGGPLQYFAGQNAQTVRGFLGVMF